jgi:hypothetical protein
MIDDLKNEHPVVCDLLPFLPPRRGCCTGRAREAVLKYGRPFTGIQRPKGYRQRAMKHCFTNSFDVTDGKRVFYVEGFALTPNAGSAFHHGWVMLDGVHAVDVTLKEATKCWYFGIPFSSKIVMRWVTRWGNTLPLIDPYASDADIEELLQDALSHPPIFPRKRKLRHDQR